MPAHRVFVTGALLLVTAIASCAPTAETAEPAAPEEPVEVEEAAAEEAPPAPPTETAVPEAPAVPEPQAVEFEAADGVKLVGTYYPPMVAPAPVVVLMHWAGGDQYDWVNEVPLALILQNPEYEQTARGAGLARPANARTNSYGVLTFNFRGFPPSGEGNRDVAYLDAQAAVQFAKTLEGAEPEAILTLGASIGADGAADGCVGPGNPAPECIGAVSLSPNSYIGMDYPAAVMDTGEMPIACVATEEDTPCFTTCMIAQEIAGDRVQTIIYPGNEHGLSMFFIENQEPPLLDFALDFLDQAVEAYRAAA